MRIGIFDSGVGGLSVLESVQRRLPKASFFYCCDSANFPYGTKTDNEVIGCTTSATRRFVEEASLDILVIACNTASTVSLPTVRSAVACPVVGVVPAVKPAAKNSKTRCIGVLATKAAAKSDYLKNLIAQFADGCEVRLCGSSKLVEMAEKKIRGIPVDLEELKAEVKDLFLTDQPNAKKIDSVVLGCTHFPLLRAELQQVAPWSVEWIDSGDAIAARVIQLMQEMKCTSQPGPSIGYATGSIADLWQGSLPEYVQQLGLMKWQQLR